jgi:hypothetical protein
MKRLLMGIAQKLAITTPIRRCTDLLEREAMEPMEPTARLVALCKAAGASQYFSGPSARGYLDPLLNTGIRAALPMVSSFQVQIVPHLRACCCGSGCRSNNCPT